MEEKNKLIKQSKIMIVMALVIVFVLAGTYAWMMISRTSTVVNKITAGTLDLILDESSSDGILIENTVPMSYQQGLTTQAYTFKLKNNSSIETDYTINLEDFYEGITVPEEGKLADSKIRYILLKDGETAQAKNSKLLSDGRAIETGKIEGTTEISYTLYVWIDSRAGVEVNGQIFSGRLNITTEQAVPTYKVSGVLTDGTNQIVANATLLGFKKSGSQVVATTDTEGKFSIDDLPLGENKIYYVPTGLDISNKTKEEVDNITGVASTTIIAPTDSQTAELTNGYVINALKVELLSKKMAYNNKNILAAYKYVAPTNIVKEDDEETVTSYDGCINGEEAQCEEITIDSTTTVNPGTIIKYKVNDTEVKYFHVLHDDGNKLTLQQTTATVDHSVWSSELSAYSVGPLDALANIENATSTWSNVNDITYAAGTTVLYQNQYTACDYYMGCTRNDYTLPERTAKARIATFQEMASVGCEETCPVWAINNLSQSAYYNGVTNGSAGEDGYWLMNTYDSEYYHSVWAITAERSLFYETDPGYPSSLRAVVEINK